MKNLFLLLSIILPLYSPLIYTKAILRGDAKPHRTTRLVLLVVACLTTLSLLAQGDRVALWLSIVSTFQAITIFILSIKHGMGGWSKNDIACLFFALTGIIAWKTTSNPTLALYFGIGADIIGMTPTLFKTYRHPETEIWTFFGIDAISGLLNIFALTSWTLEAAVYPFYIVVINLLVALLAFRKSASQDTLLRS